MQVRHVVAPALVVLTVALGAVVPAAGLASVAGQPAQTDPAGANATGIQVAAFAQSTAAGTNASLDDGMWQSQVNHSADQSQAVESRTRTLERRLQRLRNRTTELNASKADGALPAVAYNAQASAVRARIAALRDALDRTEETATRVGVNVTDLDRLRADARNLTGPEVAAIARNLTAGGPPANPPGRSGGPPDTSRNGTGPGPPDRAGSSDDGTPGNGTQVPGNRTGGDRQGNGNGAGPGNGSGPPSVNESGNGNAGTPQSGGVPAIRTTRAE